MVDHSENMSRLIFVNRYFYPDESATSQMLTDLAFALAEDGLNIHVVTSRQQIDDPLADLAPSDQYADVNIYRVWTSRWGRSNLLGRALDYLTFYFSAAIRLFRLARKDDILIAKTDPPLIGSVAAVVARLSGSKLINWWQDVYPEIAEQLGVKGIDLLARPLRAIRNSTCRAAEKNVVIGRCMLDRMAQTGIAEDTMTFIPNWADDATIRPIPSADNHLRTEWGLTDSFVIGYSGNLGRGHDFDLLLAAASLLSDNPAIRFLFIGSGAKKALVIDRVRQMGLPNVVFKSFQPRIGLGLSLTVPDVHIVSLKPELSGLIVPSKFYGAMAAGRSLIFIGPKNSEIARVIEDYDCGTVCSGSNADEIEQTIRRLHDDRALCEKQGHNARCAVDDRYNKGTSISAWREILS
jgi:glycosyltransferase involved in cell wall biosynthesis